MDKKEESGILNWNFSFERGWREILDSWDVFELRFFFLGKNVEKDLERIYGTYVEGNFDKIIKYRARNLILILIGVSRDASFIFY